MHGAFHTTNPIFCLLPVRSTAGLCDGTQQNVRFLAPEVVRLGEEVGVIMPVVHPLILISTTFSPFTYHSSVLLLP